MTVLRRQNFQPAKLSYAEIGASCDPDLLTFAPNGADVFYEERRAGSGFNRFHSVTAKLMTWRAHAEAGVAVKKFSNIENTQQDEQVFTVNGEQYPTAGSQIEFYDLAQPDKHRLYTVVRVIADDLQAGVVLGTAEAGQIDGETSFAVEMRADNEVWVCVRGFMHSRVNAVQKLVANPLKAYLAKNIAVLDALCSVNGSGADLAAKQKAVSGYTQQIYSDSQEQNTVAEKAHSAADDTSYSAT